MNGLGGVFGSHPLIALSVLFVLVKIEAFHPGKRLVATSVPYPQIGVIAVFGLIIAALLAEFALCCYYSPAGI